MKTEIKTSVEGLAVGMFVSRLDCPWSETPFLLEGMAIKSRDDIEALSEHCNFVYVDVEKGLTPSTRYQLLDDDLLTDRREKQRRNGKDSAGTDPAAAQRFRANTIKYKDTTSFETELETAKHIYVYLKAALKQVMTGLKQGRALDVKPVNEVITALTESIIRNPAAMMWVISLKKINDDSYSRPLGNCTWCTTFGRHLGLEKTDIEALALGGLLLDIGKARLPQELLKKSGPLSTAEKQQMNTHVYLGVKILEDCMKSASGGRVPVEVVNMIATHHERADGSGYPQGLKNEATPLFGRIASIVDSYDAMTSQNLHIHDEPMTPHEAMTELYELRNKKYQVELIEQFIQAVGLYPTGSLVELSTGEVGAVVAVNGLRRLRPSMVMLLDQSKQALIRYASMDLSQMNREISVARGLAFGAFGIDMNKLFQ